MQTYNNWQQSPMQGAIPNSSPFTPADEQYLQETLIDCRVKLESALSTAQGYRCLPDLTEGIADALTGVRDAIAVLTDPKTYIQ